MVKSGLGGPADVESRGDVRAGPVEYLLDFVPIVHLLEVQMFHRRSRDDHSVELLVAHVLKVTVERFHVFDGRILRRMAFQFHEAYLNLERRI